MLKYIVLFKASFIIQAIANILRYGPESVDCYVSSFLPLEWTVTHKPLTSFAKIVVNVKDNERVLGMHIVSPNAGEIIQVKSLLVYDR